MQKDFLTEALELQGLYVVDMQMQEKRIVNGGAKLYQ